MELCIKTFPVERPYVFGCICFNPCFNGTMYKNKSRSSMLTNLIRVSILVLMELCIKTTLGNAPFRKLLFVSILVLMELCIKTEEISDELHSKILVSILVLMELCIKTFFLS